ncbi:MAG: tRNA uridine-5-carboxymethylaminomethyl(34) synthesis enzyme MnmG [Gemmatimonadales bacterium]|nr:tRNA uridine-5-carboxymethylaminomethyl(34) synthesis enzyme MnmG [Gemmatimonadales bacterium]MDZ4391299.1 tRNA uridine-5-carboxymethylaminomethyl(34) synthesis enzyme MnmG [Gemmatimonadales bacterium]
MFDCLVLGGGHAGTEAAAMAARRGARVLLLTQRLDTIGTLSCNPSIGGIAKGTVVREVDALGGVMGRAADRAMIQFRMLNASKGAAVASPRAQCDRLLYAQAVQSLLAELPVPCPITFREGTAARLIRRGGAVVGVECSDGSQYLARAVVLTTGTFLRGTIHRGHDAGISAGRVGEAAATEFSESLLDLGLRVERFKTGTPPRIDGRTIDRSVMSRQDSDACDYWFSFHARAPKVSARSCWLTWAGESVKSLIDKHLHESALYGGAISGRGPRYCPSIEDKVVKFPNAARHQVFLEPEGLDTDEMYVGGLSTSLPQSVQERMLRLIPGMEQVVMTRAGYAIEYDYLPPVQLDSTLAVRGVAGLFTAGQINGTTGYEEAAGQGVIAGLNAAAHALDLAPVVIRRDQGYCGVLVDDLVVRGVDEPYRLFTSRAEFRLSMRQDNALRRMEPIATACGLWSEQERAGALQRLALEERVLELARATPVAPGDAAPLLSSASSPPIAEPMRVAELVKRPGIGLAEMLAAAGLQVDPVAAEWGEIELRYAGYLEKERKMAARLARLEERPLPPDLPYHDFGNLAIEARERLASFRPTTVGQASRLPGVSPADIQVLTFELFRREALGV